ncbi:hypothetical protein BGX20_006769 [Mortierella sp. AD010]|nr:hypothetical protein BGX20_006769 [Mortierella sp. AD010]
MLTSPSTYAHNGSHQHYTLGKSPSKRVSLQKYYYGRNAMSTGRLTPSRTPSPPALATSPLSHSIPPPSPSVSFSNSLFSAYQGTSDTPFIHSPLPRQASNAGSLSILVHGNLNDNIDNTNIHRPSSPSSEQEDMPSRTRHLSPPTLTTIMATPTSPSLPSLPSFSLPTPPPQVYPSPMSSPKLSSNDSYMITSPEKCESTPFPASSITSAELAHLIELSYGPSSSRPLILDLRANPDFCPISIAQSININLPTLLMRRYRRGDSSVSSFALESFITMPSDKDVYHQIQDSWRNAGSLGEPHNVIVLDKDMLAGNEEYGRSATAAWTLLNVLERGGGDNCFGGAPIRLWYLEGGFEAFQAWDCNEKYLVRPTEQDVEMTLAAPMETLPTINSKKPALSINTSVAFEPKQKASGRRESLFSLDTKSLQRPAGLARSQANLKPLVIPSPNNTSNLHPEQHQQSKGSWLTVPAYSSSALSPTMSVATNHFMDISHSASSDHSSSWSDSGSLNGSGHFPSLSMRLNTKHSASSLLSASSADDSFNAHLSDSHCTDDEENDNGEQEISCILPNFLYLGPEILHQSQVDELDRLGVKRILNMATECEDLLVSNRQGMEYHKIGVYDNIDADVSAGLLEAVDIISASDDSPIYIHCKAGKSRSVTATIAYLISQLRWPLNKAYQHVLQQRPCMCPNIGFVSELMRVEERILGAEKSGTIYVA